MDLFHSTLVRHIWRDSVARVLDIWPSAVQLFDQVVLLCSSLVGGCHVLEDRLGRKKQPVVKDLRDRDHEMMFCFFFLGFLGFIWIFGTTWVMEELVLWMFSWS